MKIIHIGVLLLAVFFSVGCSRSVDRSEVVGKYVANHRKGTDVVEVRSDGTYIYYYKTTDGKELTNNSSWEYGLSDNVPTITFSKFVFGLPGYGTEKSGYWIVHVEKSLTGKIRLCIDPDLNYYYEKQ